MLLPWTGLERPSFTFRTLPCQDCATCKGGRCCQVAASISAACLLPFNVPRSPKSLEIPVAGIQDARATPHRGTDSRKSSEDMPAVYTGLHKGAPIPPQYTRYV